MNVGKFINHSAFIIIIFVCCINLVLVLVSMVNYTKLNSNYNELSKIVDELRDMILNITKHDELSNGNLSSSSSSSSSICTARCENYTASIKNDIDNINMLREKYLLEQQILIRNVYKTLEQQISIKKIILANDDRLSSIEQNVIMIQTQKYLQSIGVIKDNLIVDSYNTIYSTTNYNGLFTLDIDPRNPYFAIKIVPKKIIIAGVESSLDLDLNGINVYINGSQTLSEFSTRLLKLESLYIDNELKVREQLILTTINLIDNVNVLKNNENDKKIITNNEVSVAIKVNNNDFTQINQYNTIIIENHVINNTISVIEIYSKTVLSFEMSLMNNDVISFKMNDVTINNVVPKPLSFMIHQNLYNPDQGHITYATQSKMQVSDNYTHSNMQINGVFLRNTFDGINNKSTHVMSFEESVINITYIHNTFLTVIFENIFFVI